MTETVPAGETLAAPRSFHPFGGPRSPVVADPKTLSTVMHHRLSHIHDLHGRCVKNRFEAPGDCKVATPAYVQQDGD